VDYLEAYNPDGLWLRRRGYDYGDWLSVKADTDKDMFATLHYFRSASLLSHISGVLDRDPERARYAALAHRVRDAFNKRWFKNGGYLHATQTVYALALGFGIAPDASRTHLARLLVEDIRKRGWHLSTGFNGTRWLLPVLSEFGFDEVAHRLLLNRDYPGWGYTVSKGATTIWERWNGDTEKPDMNSFNHYSFGAVGEWMFRYLAGIDGDDAKPGYKHLLVRPRPVLKPSSLVKPSELIRSVKAEYESIHGLVRSEWEVGKKAFVLKLLVPPNVTAAVTLPGSPGSKNTEEVGAGKHLFRVKIGG
jgi:alpha-L-rhamnosidase